MLKAPKWLLSLVLLALITATYEFEPFPFQQAEALRLAQSYQPIDVLILESPLTRYRDASGLFWGLDFERLQDFSQFTGLKLRIKTFKSKEALEKAYQEGQGRLIIAREDLKLPQTFPGPLFEEIESGLFCHRRLLKTPLNTLKIQKVTGHLDSVVKKVATQKLDCFESELQLGKLATQTYLTVQLRQTLKTKAHYTWLIRNNSESLQTLLHSWYRKATRSGQFNTITHRFVVTLKTLSESDIRRFHSRREEVLPQYFSAFQEVAKDVNLPWALLAAVAYQESQWEHKAVSYTGVKGLMQLTRQTAEHMGVTDREDPFQSIWGGARYLKHLWQQWSFVKNSKDRLLLTLASYNIGIAHMHDVMDLLEAKGLPQHKWPHIEAVLPTLEQEHVYQDLRYGFARGRETVDFVNRTYSFFQILSLQRSHF